ncbi:RHS repeat-associated core domain-containing protein, partial [Variovorax sp. YR266]|uniref:RHS repeat-associated core domain-containing protein n=1 Tax=Variovorax sp. YR266 TaxID=1884386 RepID=UPI00089AD0E0
LIAEVGSGGTNSAGQSQYIYLPTGNGPMPVAAIVNGATYAIHSDHLNTPRKLTNEDGQAVWQWGYSAFGEDKPTTAKNRFANTETTPNPGTTSISEVKFNLRYPGQYSDDESGLFYNYFRSYDARTGRYSQPDPIGLGGGWNRRTYGLNNPLRYTDPDGLLVEVGPVAVGGGVLAIGCSLSKGCRKAMNDVAQSCGRAVDWLKDRMFSDGGVSPDPESGRDPDRGDLTKAGRAQQKHGDRQGSAFDPARGTPADKNEQGQKTLDGIVNSPSRVDKPNRHGGTDVHESPGGRGARFGPDGKFTGFLEP